MKNSVYKSHTEQEAHLSSGMVYHNPTVLLSCEIGRDIITT